MTGEWGPWVDHCGTCCPVVGILVQAYRACGGTETGIPDAECAAPTAPYVSLWLWADLPEMFIAFRIIRYRRHRPKALRDLINLVEGLPALDPVGVMA